VLKPPLPPTYFTSPTNASSSGPNRLLPSPRNDHGSTVSIVDTHSVAVS
jgi:hypothetical protein